MKLAIIIACWILILLLLSACTTPQTMRDETGIQWTKTRPAVSEENWKFHVSSLAEVKKLCYFTRNPYTIACTIADFYKCDIYLPTNYTPYLLWHEQQHCKGWTHG